LLHYTEVAYECETKTIYIAQYYTIKLTKSYNIICL